MIIKNQPDRSRQIAFMEVCPDCHGNGVVVTYYQYADGQSEPDEYNCDRCGRTGMIISKVSNEIYIRSAHAGRRGFIGFEAPM